MKFSVLTYNLLYNRANSNINKFLSKYHPDILCLQEIETSESNLKKIELCGYKLADYSNSFIKSGKIMGVATFYNPKTFYFSNSQSFNLPRSFYEFMKFVLSKNHSRRTVLKTLLHSKKTKKTITVYNLHLPPLATNNIRDRQIRNTFEDLHLGKRNPIIIAGDFNYPYGRKKFEILIHKYGLEEATNNIFFTLEAKVLKMFYIKLKLDYILYKNIKLNSTERIQVRHSDHFPIISHFYI